MPLVPTLDDEVNGDGRVSGRGSNGYYEAISTTDNWQEVDLGFVSAGQLIVCDTANAAHFSYSTGGNLTLPSTKPIHGLIREDERIQFEQRFTSKIYVKSASSSSAADLHIYAW